LPRSLPASNPLKAPLGAGKTTRVPRALLEAGIGGKELSERLGETVGYQVRFEDVSGPKTRLRLVTEGVLVMSATLEADPIATYLGGVRGDVTFARVAPGARPVGRGSACRPGANRHQASVNKQW
jgi:hypothetical protein